MFTQGRLHLLSSLLLSLILLAGSDPVNGQQLPLFSQYFQSGVQLNPAFAGVDNFTDVKVGYRQQWAGLPGSPQSFYLSGSGLLMKPADAKVVNSLRISNPDELEEEGSGFSRKEGIKMGWGGFLVSDSYGPYSGLSGYFNYAFHYPLSREIYLSVGLAGGLNNTRVNLSEVRVRDEDQDLTYQNFLANGGQETVFDVNGGVMVYGKHFQVGYTMLQLLSEETIVSDQAGMLNTASKTHHYLVAGMNFRVGEGMRLFPSVVYRGQENFPSVIDYSAKLLMNQNFWAGATYRDDNSIILLTGFYLNNKYSIGYSYDHKLSGITEFNNSSHEVVLGLMFNTEKQERPYLW
jgi:type IX secretion system PorP/SprF family membrane protein